MRRLVASLLAGLAALPAASPASASPGTGFDWAGFGCQWESAYDHDGLFGPRYTYYGELDGGPMAVVTDATDVLETSIRCSIQLSIDPAAPDVATATATWRGNVAVLPPSYVAFTISVYDSPYVCTEITWRTASGTFRYEHDEYPRQPGIQCADLVGH